MKKIVLTFGLICGVVLSLTMAATVLTIDRIGMDKGVIVGYTTMLVSFLLVFFGIRSYRENVGGGQISFGRAFSVGILIMIIACLCYVIMWQIVYTNFAPDFLEKYTNYTVEQLRASGASQAVIDANVEDFRKFGAWYKNPLFRALVTFLEPLPIGLPVTLISAVILRRKNRKKDGEENAGELIQTT
ncbi:MAG TPA: DUF4199 domain-containing protein [Pyrinomonadaceae bacterium]|nr:DUF4199 domain-containing protein [Pyrinomonadaceae bacterium]